MLYIYLQFRLNFEYHCIKSMKEADKIRISIYLDVDLLEKIKDEALKMDRSVNYILVKSLKETFTPDSIDQSAIENT